MDFEPDRGKEIHNRKRFRTKNTKVKKPESERNLFIAAELPIDQALDPVLLVRFTEVNQQS